MPPPLPTLRNVIGEGDFVLLSGKVYYVYARSYDSWLTLAIVENGEPKKNRRYGEFDKKNRISFKRYHCLPQYFHITQVSKVPNGTYKSPT